MSCLLCCKLVLYGNTRLTTYANGILVTVMGSVLLVTDRNVDMGKRLWDVLQAMVIDVRVSEIIASDADHYALTELPPDSISWTPPVQPSNPCRELFTRQLDNRSCAPGGRGGHWHDAGSIGRRSWCSSSSTSSIGEVP